MATTSELAAFWTKVEGTKEPIIKCWGRVNPYGPDLASCLKNWTVEPTTTKIDLSSMIGSGILCEFWDNQTADCSRHMSELSYIDKQSKEPFLCAHDWWWEHCLPLTNHLHALTIEQVQSIPDGFNLAVERDTKLSVNDSGLDDSLSCTSAYLKQDCQLPRIMAVSFAGTTPGCEL